MTKVGLTYGSSGTTRTLIKVNSSDTVATSLEDSLVAGAGTTITPMEVDGDTKLEIGVSSTLGQPISLNVGSSAGEYTSTEVIPSDSVILSARLVVLESYDEGITIEIRTTGTSPYILIDSTENNPASENTYKVEPSIKLPSDSYGFVRAIVSGSSLVGSAVVFVEYM